MGLECDKNLRCRERVNVRAMFYVRIIRRLWGRLTDLQKNVGK